MISVWMFCLTSKIMWYDCRVNQKDMLRKELDEQVELLADGCDEDGDPLSPWEMRQIANEIARLQSILGDDNR